jgi:hypothetical protein
MAKETYEAYDRCQNMWIWLSSHWLIIKLNVLVAQYSQIVP